MSGKTRRHVTGLRSSTVGPLAMYSAGQQCYILALAMPPYDDGRSSLRTSVRAFFADGGRSSASAAGSSMSPFLYSAARYLIII